MLNKVSRLTMALNSFISNGGNFAIKPWIILIFDVVIMVGIYYYLVAVKKNPPVANIINGLIWLVSTIYIWTYNSNNLLLPEILTILYVSLLINGQRIISKLFTSERSAGMNNRGIPSQRSHRGNHFYFDQSQSRHSSQRSVPKSELKRIQLKQIKAAKGKMSKHK